MGIEYMHLTNYDQLEWVRKRFETPLATQLSPDDKKTLFKRLIRSTKFEEFLAKKVGKFVVKILIIIETSIKV